MQKKLSYLEDINSDILDRIPLTSKKVVEFGCGSAAMAAEFKNRCPNCQYIGIQQISEVSNLAKARLDTLIRADLETDIELPNNLDCLIYSNVLEKLNDPFTCVERHLKNLNNSGTFIACITNSQHWKMINQLIYGSWQFNDEALFDKTHLYRFTLQNIKEFVLSLGLTITEVQPRVFHQKAIDNFVDNIKPALSNFGVDQDQFVKCISPSQFVIRAVKNSPKRIQINYLKTALDVKGLSISRIEESFKSLSTIPGIEFTQYETPIFKFPQDENDSIKILMSYRPIYNPTKFLSAIDLILKKDYLLIIDFDDHPNIINDKMARDFTFKCCHAVHTTNHVLANIIREYNPEVYTFTNNIISINPTIEKDENTIKVFFGALNRENDWRPWIDTLNAVLSKNTKKWYFEVIHDKKFYNEINLPKEQKSFTPICEYKQYLDIMSRCDISFMPLENTLFNRCKSDLKAVQAASYSLSILSTPVVYSTNFINHETAAFFRSKNELFKILSSWSQNPVLMRQIGKNSQKYVSQNRLYANQIDKKIECFVDLWKRRDGISEKLLKRIEKFR